MKSKKFIASMIIIFLVFAVAGKYTNSRSALSSNYVYATTVKDTNTGEKYQYEVQMISKDKVKVTKSDAETGKTIYEEVYPATATADKIEVKLPKEDTSLVVERSNNPLSVNNAPKVTVDSNKYKQMNDSKVSVVEPVSGVSDSSRTVTSEPYSSEDVEKQSSNMSSDNSSSSTKPSSSHLSSSSQTEKSDNSKTEIDFKQAIAELSEDETEHLIADFGKWLFDSNYGKKAIVVRGTYDQIINTGSASPTFWMAKTTDGDLLGRMIGYDGSDMSKVENAYIPESDQYDSKGQDLVHFKDSIDLTLLGNDLTSNDSKDFQATSVFRIYHLKDSEHKYYENDEEYDSEIDGTVPDEEIVGAQNNGYNYFYKKLVDNSLPSYQILLANNGKIYLVNDYFLKDAKSTEYTLAANDMQEAYQKLIEKYIKSKKENTKVTETKNSSVYPTDMIGTWGGDVGAQGYQEVTYNADGTAVLKVDNMAPKTGSVRKIEKVSGNLYRFVDYDFDAAFPVFGLGGAGFRMESGFRLEKDKITYVYWTGELNTEFNPSSYKINELSSFKKISN
ncbi:hypothetical protein [Streptococcus orisratti]